MQDARSARLFEVAGIKMGAGSKASCNADAEATYGGAGYSARMCGVAGFCWRTD